MFLIYECTDAGNTDSSREICTFYGIRYNRNGFAVLSTEHSKHDYLLPMSREAFEAIADKISNRIKDGAEILTITGSPVYRVRRGAMLPLDDSASLNYDIG